MLGGDGKEVDAGEYCSFPTYFNLWKCDFPDPKVSRPVEDISKDCYALTATGISKIAQWDAIMMMAKATTMAMGMATVTTTTMTMPMAETARVNVAMTDAAMMAATIMAARTFPMLESAQLGT